MKRKQWEAARQKGGTTNEARRLSEALRELGVENRLEEELCFAGSVFFADIYIPSVNWVVEVDGPYHLSDPLVRASDVERTKMLLLVVAEVKRVQNWEVRADVGKVAQRIVAAIEHGYP